MSFCKDCISGVRHEGTPEGKIVDANGVPTYVATPSIDYPKDKAVLFVSDLFGIELINNKLLVDDFARNGFYTVIPDYFNGDAVAADAMDPGKTFDLATWFGRHQEAQCRPPIDKTIAWLKGQGVTKIGAVGYCFGARYVFDLAFENAIDSAVVSHPSLLKAPEDIEKYAKCNVPLLINSCTVDQQFPHESQAIADEILGGGKFKPGYKREYFEGCTHGFAVRGDLSDPKVKAGKEGAFKASVEWLINTL